MNKQQQEEFGEMKSDIKWIIQTNKDQNVKIDDIQKSINTFIEKAPNSFASKIVEEQVHNLTNWKYWAMGGFGMILIIISWILTIIF